MISISNAAANWSVAERTVRNYCANGRIPVTVLAVMALTALLSFLGTVAAARVVTGKRDQSY